MNAREILKNEIIDAESYHLGQGDWTNTKKAAALRELDQLIMDMRILARQKLMGENVSNWEDLLQFWCERAAQAGYGEK